MAAPRPNPVQSNSPDPAAPYPAAIDTPVRYLLLVAIASGLGWGVWRLVSSGAAAPAAGFAVAFATLIIWLGLMTPGDPAQGRFGRIAVPGVARLAGELVVLGLAALAIWKAGSRAAAETLLTVAGLHYALTWERVAWLLGRDARTRRRERRDTERAGSGG